MARMHFWETIWSDIRCGIRVSRKNPVATLTAILTLGLGIGATIAVFGLMDAVVLRQLPVQEPKQLVVLRRADPGYAGTFSFSYPKYNDLNRQQHILSGLLASFNAEFAVRVREEAQRVNGDYVSGNYFEVLGVRPKLGRLLVPSDDTAASSTAVVSYAFWQNRMAGQQSAIGQTIYLEDLPVTVVGVMPPEFYGLDLGRRAEVMVPASFVARTLPDSAVLTSNGFNAWELIGRCNPNVDSRKATAGLRVIWPSVLKELGRPEDTEQIDAVPASSGVSGPLGLRDRYGAALRILMASVGLMLLVACASVSNILLARGNARQHEFGVRFAVGASRSRLLCQILTENSILALVGGTLGLWFAYFGTRWLVTLSSTARDPVVLNLRPDWRLASFTILVTCGAAAISGIIPALRASAACVRELAHGGTLAIGKSRQTRANRAFLAWQIAISIPLLIGSTVFLRSLEKLYSVDTGFDSRDVLIFRVNWGRTKLNGTELGNVMRDAIARISAIPGVRSASFSNFTPFGGNNWTGPTQIEGESPRPASETRSYINQVSSKFFDTFGTDVLLGHSFDPESNFNVTRTIVVNESFVRSFSSSQNPIGRWVLVPGVNPSPYEIVGVVKDTKYSSLRNTAPRQVYLPFSPAMTHTEALALEVRLMAKPSSSREATLSLIRDDLHQLEQVGTIEMTTLATQVGDSLRAERIVTAVSTCLGMIGLVLSALGLYGLVSYAVAQRVVDIGIRLALGATKMNVLWMITREHMRTVLFGVGIGIPLAVILMRLSSKWLSGILYDSSISDPIIITIPCIALIAVALIATYLPARKVMKLDPAAALRHQ
jgi:predicted permease